LDVASVVHEPKGEAMTDTSARLEALLASPTLEAGALDFVQPPELVQFIAGKLGETEPKPIAELTELVNRWGREVCLELLRRTLEAEARGGTLTLGKESRRRTCGGTFFWLARMRTHRDERKARQQLDTEQRPPVEAQRKARARTAPRKAKPPSDEPKPMRPSEKNQVEVVVMRKRRP
jgi:hypothetical protein